MYISGEWKLNRMCGQALRITGLDGKLLDRKSSINDTSADHDNGTSSVGDSIGDSGQGNGDDLHSSVGITLEEHFSGISLNHDGMDTNGAIESFSTSNGGGIDGAANSTEFFKIADTVYDPR